MWALRAEWGVSHTMLANLLKCRRHWYGWRMDLASLLLSGLALSLSISFCALLPLASYIDYWIQHLVCTTFFRILVKAKFMHKVGAYGALAIIYGPCLPKGDLAALLDLFFVESPGSIHALMRYVPLCS